MKAEGCHKRRYLFEEENSKKFHVSAFRPRSLDLTGACHDAFRLGLTSLFSSPRTDGCLRIGFTHEKWLGNPRNLLKASCTSMRSRRQ